NRIRLEGFGRLTESGDAHSAQLRRMGRAAVRCGSASLPACVSVLLIQFFELLIRFPQLLIQGELVGDDLLQLVVREFAAGYFAYRDLAAVDEEHGSL